MARDRSTVKRCLAALALLETLKEEDDRVTKRGQTRHWIKRRGEKGYFNKIAAAERLTVTLRFLARERRKLSIPTVSIFVFRERRFHSSPVSTVALPFLFLFAERSFVLSSESDWKFYSFAILYFNIHAERTKQV